MLSASFIFHQMQLVLLYLTSLVASYLVLESQWKNSDSCAGPPTSMYYFKVSDLESHASSENETWSDYYSFHANEIPVYICGNLALDPNNQCCYSSIDSRLSFGYKSGAPFLLEEGEDLDAVVPKSTNNHQYCTFVTQQDEDESIIPILLVLTNIFDAIVIKHCIFTKKMDAKAITKQSV
ncbi:hypothetical protein BC833DRAFT_606745 [Globomyces pollinis-pini]|nr:hypothetical protein BC833DRAFT_606745 [Globomyces pollinis-pini]